MTSKTHKRKETTVLPAEDSDTSSSAPMARAALTLLTAHRWKAAAAVAVVVACVLVIAGFVGFGNPASQSAQYAPDRSAGAPAASSAAQPAARSAVTVASKPELKTCFTPGQDCMGMIVAAIDSAKSEVLVQAYSFQAKPLVKALGRARQRGVTVRVILDKADEREPNSAGARLIAQRILPQVDTGVASAHNKVMIIDRDSVITGSFSFTEAAQKKNAENVLLIKGYPDIAAAYAKNWQKRLAASRPYYGTMAPIL